MGSTQLLSLVEYIAYKINCDYISDLPCLDALGRAKAARVIENVPTETYPLSQWNDALQYIVHGRTALTAAEARTALMDKLCDRQLK